MIKSLFNCSVNKKKKKTQKLQTQMFTGNILQLKTGTMKAGLEYSAFLVVAKQAWLPVMMLRFDHKAFVPPGGALFFC